MNKCEHDPDYYHHNFISIGCLFWSALLAFIMQTVMIVYIGAKQESLAKKVEALTAQEK